MEFKGFIAESLCFRLTCHPFSERSEMTCDVRRECMCCCKLLPSERQTTLLVKRSRQASKTPEGVPCCLQSVGLATGREEIRQALNSLDVGKGREVTGW